MTPSRTSFWSPRKILVFAVAACAPVVLSIACGDGSPSTSAVAGSASATGTAAVSATSSSGSSSVASTSGSTASSSASGAGGAGGAGGNGAGASGVGGSADAGDEDAAVVCSTEMGSFPLGPALHLPICTPIVYPTNPPTSGPHYPVWAAYKTYTIPIPRGFYVHDLEHGGIVVTYNCASNCDADLAALQAYIDARPADPECMPPPPKARITVTPDPLLDVKFAASAWGFSIKSNCFDLVALDTFINTHYGMGPEDFCTDGIDLAQPGAFPPGCGDISDAGVDDASDAAD